MANIVKPKLFDMPTSPGGKIYNYGGDLIDPFNNEHPIDYSAIEEQEKKKKANKKTEPIVHSRKKPKVTKKVKKPTIKEKIKMKGKKLFASYINAGVSFVKGATSFVEAVVDTAVMAGAAIATVAYASADVAELVVAKATGEEWDGFSNTKAYWTEDIMPAVGTNVTQKVFDKVYYDTALGKWADENAGEKWRQNGDACKIAEGIGYYTGVVVLATATAGLGTGALASTSVAHGVVAATAAMGRNTQQAYNKLSDEEKMDSGAISKTLAVSASKALIEGATYAAGVQLGNAAKLAWFNGIASDAGKVVAKQAVGAAIQGGIKSTRALANEEIDHIAYGEDFSWRDVGISTAATFGAEVLGAGIQTAVGLGFNSNVLPSSVTSAQAAQAAANQVAGVANGSSNIANLVGQSTDPLEKSVSYASSEWVEGLTQNAVEGATGMLSEAAISSSDEIIHEVAEEAARKVVEKSAAAASVAASGAISSAAGQVGKKATEQVIQTVLEAA